MTSSPWVPMDPVDPRMMTVELEAMLTVPSSYRHCSVWGTTGRGYPNRSYRQAGTAAGTNRWNRAYPVTAELLPYSDDSAAGREIVLSAG